VDAWREERGPTKWSFAENLREKKPNLFGYILGIHSAAGRGRKARHLKKAYLGVEKWGQRGLHIIAIRRAKKGDKGASQKLDAVTEIPYSVEVEGSPSINSGWPRDRKGHMHITSRGRVFGRE